MLTIARVIHSTEVPEGLVERVQWSNGRLAWRAVSNLTGRSYNERSRQSAERTLRTVHAVNR